MGFVGCVLAVLLLVQPWTTTSSFLSPFLSPFFGEVCRGVECGRGTCKPSENSTYNFECECSQGWKQARPDNHYNYSFLPCLIPDCTLDHSCGNAPSPVQDKEQRANDSIFDPCYWTDCGGGTCNKTSAFAHECQCSDGYYNLLNVTAFPCFKECAIGMDCKNLGISVTNRSTSSHPPILSDHGANQASSKPRSIFNWLVFGSMIGVLFLGK